MRFMLDRSIKKPMYRQLVEQIENGIISGDLSQDQPLPSERELAKKLQINRSTVVTAYDELEAIGLIVRKKGSGTYINTDIWGLTHKRVPNWGRYVEDGSFLPNLPLVQKLRNETDQKGMINLSSGELAADLLPNVQFARIFKEHVFDEHLGYDHPLGDEGLRETICKHVKTYKNMDVEPNSVLITSGAQQAIHLIVQCLLKPGDTVAIEDPSYAFSLPIFQSFGVRTLLLPVDQYGVNPDDIEALQRKYRIRMLFLNPDYQNPTGTKMSLERRKRILELSSKYGIPIIEDDPYNLTSFAGCIGPTLKSMDGNENVLYISSLSKVVASGLRIGWIIGPEKVIKRLSDGRQQIDFGHSVFPQWIANRFLDSPQFEKHVSNLRIQLRERRNALILALDSLSNEVTYLVPQGGIHLWCKITDEIDEFKLLEESMKNGVSFVPGRIMGSKSGYARFTYGKGNGASIQEGISRFATALRSYGV
ncbi:transcriptional regulator [Sporosarcina sp. NCCP-2222]|uniref:MocR-like pyridoxine biosynthesis transcription factor PdxR n=1 Tax=Sporosarcina sp. NCCP-2222 TaxID=2935073 RepID=UPI00207E1BD4|nr:PLP-dependent aminotransferase family protein [Sporosarcina sp. NCCP-2222]GKV56343.1 transcriptional regulator [Sporosarcina sp. NCCP-2222]